jgi:hypothetical protein
MTCGRGTLLRTGGRRLRARLVERGLLVLRGLCGAGAGGCRR